jgi:hypothetical protein
MNGLQMKYFVLKPGGDDEFAKASRIAMKAFAQAISSSSLTLATDLMNWAQTETELYVRREQERIKSEPKD